jgi:hypothetical protein
MFERVSRAFDEISKRYHEFFLLYSSTSLEFSNLSFYIDDFFESYSSEFFFLYWYLRKKFLSRLKWARYCLIFKKFKVWQTKIQMLKMTHEIDDKIYVLENRIRKIINFSVSINVIEVREFLEMLEITRRWIFNFLKLRRSLIRLIEKIFWKWEECEQLSFEILKIKIVTIIIMHEVDLLNRTHFYTNASEFARDMMITQKREIDDKIEEVFILYDFFTFNVTQRRYSTYKKKLCAMIKLVTKYDYLAQHLYKKAIVHIDYKSLIHFLITINDVHDEIYEHWIDQLRRLNVKIRYISESRNKIVDELSRTIFRTDDCEKNSVLFETLQNLRDQRKLWIWSDKKNEYIALLNRLFKKNREKMIQKETLHDVFVFSLEINDDNFWTTAYETFEWFENVHRFLRNENSSFSKTFRESMSYKLNSEIDIL